MTKSRWFQVSTRARGSPFSITIIICRGSLFPAVFRGETRRERDRTQQVNGWMNRGEKGCL